MKRTEVEKALRRMKIRVGPATLQAWAKEGLIPGFTGGRQHADWSDWAVPQAAAASHLIGNCGWQQRRVILARTYLWRRLESGRSIFPELDSWLKYADKKTYRRNFEWLMAVLKARCGLPVDRPATVTEVEDLETNTVRYVGGKPAKGPKGTHPREVDRLLSATR